MYTPHLAHPTPVRFRTTRAVAVDLHCTKARTTDGKGRTSSIAMTRAVMGDGRMHFVERDPDMPEPLKKGQRPTKRAIRLANAIMLEKKLAAMGTRSLRQASEQLGVSTGVLRRVLRMLALTPEEMQREIFATY